MRTQHSTALTLALTLVLYSCSETKTVDPDNPDLGPLPDLSKVGPCDAAQPLELKEGKASAEGEILATDLENKIPLSASGCMKEQALGAEKIYSVALPGNRKYLVTLEPGAMYDAGLFIFTDCADPAGSCVAGADKNVTGHEEQLTLEVGPNTAYYIAVSSKLAAGESFSYGTFQLSVEEIIEQSNDECLGAATFTLKGDGWADGEGDTTEATNTASLGPSHCVGKATPGEDFFYSLAVTVGTTYKVHVNPDTGFDPVLYIFTDCAQPGDSCLAGVDDNLTGSAEELVFKAEATGSVIIAVDSAQEAGSSYSRGLFVLRIDEIQASSNDACGQAKALTFVGGKIEEPGDTAPAQNLVALTAGDCTGKVSAGKDLFYRVNLTAGNEYTFTLFSPSFDESLYIFTDCANIASTCGGGMGADQYTDNDRYEEVVFTPDTSGTYLIGVDGRNDGEEGEFTLTVTEQVVGGNDTCATPQPMAFSGSTAAASGDTGEATDTVNLDPSSCVSLMTPGPDLFYSIQLTGGQSYTVSLIPESSYDSSLYIFTDCADPDSSCLAGWGKDAPGSGNSDVVTFTPPATGTYIIGVDSGYGFGKGTFSLTVQ